MYISFYLTIKYWIKHKKNLAALIFSAVLATSVILTFWLNEREKTNRVINKIYSYDGYRNLQAANISDDIRERILNENPGVKLGSSFVYGEIGSEENFAFGTLDDPYDLFRIPFESGGMPSAKGEIAVDRAVLDRLYWVGKCGGNITIGGESYTVCGIFDISHRYGSQLAPSVNGNDDAVSTLPLIIFSECDGEPIGRLDYFADIFDKHMTTKEAENSQKCKNIEELLYGSLIEDSQWYVFDFLGSGKIGGTLSETDMDDVRYYLRLFSVGAVIAALSVFTVLRTVFKDRENNIRILDNIGMSRKKRAALYCTECGTLAVIQTAAGFLTGSAAHLAAVLFKMLFLGEKFISGFSSDPFVTSRSCSPFLISGIISAAITVSAYILNILTIKTRRKISEKNASPRSLHRCFAAVFRGGTTSVIQIVSLALIASCSALCYMNFTHNGKYVQAVMLGAPNDTLSAGGIDLEESGVEEYYVCRAPETRGIISIFNPTCGFYITENEYSLGIGDDIAAQLPEYAHVSGMLKHPFVISEEPIEDFTNLIDFTEKEVRNLLTEASSNEYKNFFDNGQIGSKILYQAPIRVVDEKTLLRLSDSVVSGGIDIDALNSGREILIVSQDSMVTFDAGRRLVFGSAASGENITGIGSINVSESVTVGGSIVLPRDEANLLNRLVATEENNMEYNFITTARGAEAIGIHGSRYTEIFSEKEMDGSVIPSSAQMELISRKILKRELVIERVKKSSAVIVTLIMMSLLGFSAYFNGIGIKIRNRAFEISVLRAVGTPIKGLRKTLIANSVKIPLISFAIGYAALKIIQTAADNMANKWDMLWSSGSKFVRELDETGLMRNNWWQANLEFPIIILLLVFIMVTVLLTLIALKKFQKDIARDLNSGRTKQ